MTGNLIFLLLVNSLAKGSTFITNGLNCSHSMIKLSNLLAKTLQIYLADINIGIIVKAGKNGKNGGDSHRHQNIGNTWIDLLQNHHDRNRANSIHQSGEVGIIHRGLSNPGHSLIMMSGLVYVNTKKLGELRRGNDNGRSVGKTVNHRMGEKVDHQTEAKHTQGQLEDTHGEGQNNRIGNKLGASSRS